MRDNRFWLYLCLGLILILCFVFLALPYFLPEELSMFEQVGF